MLDKITSVINMDDLIILNLLITKFELSGKDKINLRPIYNGGLATFDGNICKNNRLMCEFESDKVIRIQTNDKVVSLPWPSPTGIRWFTKQLENVKL